MPRRAASYTQTLPNELGKWMLFDVIYNWVCDPRWEMGRPAFVVFYGGSLNS